MHKTTQDQDKQDLHDKRDEGLKDHDIKDKIAVASMSFCPGPYVFRPVCRVSPACPGLVSIVHCARQLPTLARNEDWL